MDLILASASPRRAQLLNQMGLSFFVRESPVDESSLIFWGSPRQRVQNSAKIKTFSVAKLCPEALVVGADTMVFLGQEPLGKPKNAEEAKTMLRKLQGKRHQVITGVCGIRRGKRPFLECLYECTQVWMSPLSEDEICRYVETGEPLDKAGAYGIQGHGGVFISRIEGCYFNVMGLPLHKTAYMLKRAGINLWHGGGR